MLHIIREFGLDKMNQNERSVNPVTKEMTTQLLQVFIFSNACNLTATNPILVRTLKMLEKFEKEFKLPNKPCITCNEGYFDQKIQPRAGRCERCKRHLNLDYPPYSKANFMWPDDLPKELKDLNLTYIEWTAIKPINPLMHFYRRRGGMAALRGNSIGQYHQR